MKIKAIVIAVSIASCAGVALANTQTDSAKQLTESLKNVSKEMQSLQGQIKNLRGQVASLKSKLNQKKSVPRVKHVTVVHNKAKPMKQFGSTGKTHKYFNTMHHFGTSVVLAPSTGVPSHYDGSDFIINAPSVNVNRYVLDRTAQQLTHYKKKYGEEPTLPALVISGDILGIVQYDKTYGGNNNSDIDLTNADLMLQAVLTPWVSGVMELSYDNAAEKDSTRRIDNSRVFLKQGFIDIGNMNRSPVYGTIGQFYVPFGRYSSIMISDPLTKYLGRARARAVEIGYAPVTVNHFYGEAFAYRGAASTSQQSNINNYGLDTGFKYKIDKFVFNFGVSAVRNIADADAMQDTGGAVNNFQGFSETPGAEKISHVVPGGDIHMNIGYSHFTLIGEFVSALKRFSAQNISFDGKGARPSAFTFEGDYSFNMFHIPSTFGLSYGHSYQSLGFNIPSQRYLAALQMAVQRFTLLTIEYAHDKNYAGTNTSTHTTADGTVIQAFNSADIGKSSNTVTAQLAVYF